MASAFQWLIELHIKTCQKWPDKPVIDVIFHAAAQRRLTPSFFCGGAARIDHLWSILLLRHGAIFLTLANGGEKPAVKRAPVTAPRRPASPTIIERVDHAKNHCLFIEPDERAAHPL
jgi:hypothetical protein